MNVPKRYSIFVKDHEKSMSRYISDHVEEYLENHEIHFTDCINKWENEAYEQLEEGISNSKWIIFFSCSPKFVWNIEYLEKGELYESCVFNEDLIMFLLEWEKYSISK